MSRHVFLSHSHEDAKIAGALLAVFESRGIKCWIAPRNVPAGGSYAEAIMEAIEKAFCVVLIYSANANVSPFVLREVERALTFGVNIIPVRFDESNVSRSLDFLLATVHWLSALSEPREAALEEVTRRIAATIPPSTATLSAESGRALERVRWLLSKFFRPLHVRLRRDTLSWERILDVRAPDGSIEQRLARSVERDYIFPNHDEMIAIIEEHSHLVEDDAELMAQLDDYQRHVVLYKSIRAAGDTSGFPLNHGAPWPDQFAPLIARRVKALEGEQERLENLARTGERG